MARKRKPGAGRKPKARKAIILRLVLSLDPKDDADLISKFSQAPERGKALLAINLMRNGMPNQAPVLVSGKVVIDIDDSEF